MSNDIQLLTNRLLAALNSNYEVIDMSSVLSVITQLEQTTITKEQLEATRLGKFINLLRRQTWSGPLARRAKNLLKKWRGMLITPACTTQQPIQQQLPTGLTSIESQPRQRISHPLHVSLSQPTSPVAQSSGSQRSSHHHLAPPRRIENSSMPEYPCCNSSSMTKNVPSTSKKDQLSNISNGSNNNTDQASSTQRSQSSKGMMTLKSSKSPQHQSSKKQPISFANLIESQFHPPGPGRSCAGPSFIMDDNRSQSPLTLPRIPIIPRDRQSPMIIEHSVSPLDLDQNSNPSREGSLAPTSIVSGPANLAVMNNNNTISSCSRLLNGDYTATSIDLHDSNSNSNMAGNLDTIMEVQQRLLGSRSSEHRKSKKHKKEKRRHRQERLHEAALSGSTEVNAKPAADDRVPVLSDETQICSGALFPMQENLSLSNSSLSMFPSTSTNITVTNSNRGAISSSQKLESDLTFAGKFKKSSNVCTTGGHGVSDVTLSDDTRAIPLVPPLVDNGQDTSYATVINPVKKTKHKDGRSSIVVIESRSCSPFTPIGGHSNDSSTSSSRTSNRDLIEVVNQESQGVEDVRMRPKLLPQPQSLQQLKPIAIESLVPVENKTPKRRGRKKGSKGADAMLAQFNTQLFEGSRLLSLASLSGNKKVKTTKELLADIQSRKLESTTSSPTLPSQSRPPSTSSEPSLHSPSTSDACSTNATMSTVARSTPDENLVTASNFRTSGLDEDSASNSCEVAVIEKKGSLNFDHEAKSVTKMEEMYTIEDDIKLLMSSLPPINRENINIKNDDDVICTCIVKEVQQQQQQQQQQEQIDVVKSEVENADENEMEIGDMMKTNVGENIIIKPIRKHETTSVPVPRALPPVIIKLQQKPVKSIFDLDYDEDNDPLQGFVEAAKTCKTESNDDTNRLLDIKNSPLEGKHQDDVIISVSLPMQQEQQPISTTEIESGNDALNNNIELVQPALAPPVFPQFEVLEDPNCLAKERYEIRTVRITKFHIDALHNSYMPNVNGNWDESEQKKLEDDDKRNIVPYDEITPVDLYERVVPQYNFLLKDRIPKDLSHIQFTKKYNKIKNLKLEKIRNKRKRSLLSTYSEDDERKHQRINDCSKHETTPCQDMVSKNVVIESDVDCGFDKNMNLNNYIDSLSDNSKTIDTEKPNADRMDYSSDDIVNVNVTADNKLRNVTATINDEINATAEPDDSMAVSGRIISNSPPPELATNSNSNHNSNSSGRSSSCSNYSINLNNTLSDNNNSSKPNNDISNNMSDVGDNSVDNEELSYGHSNCSDDCEVDDDAEYDDEYDDDDDDEDDDDDDDYDDHGDFHEVVTHDMTSSTSTIGNKLVLTIKKTPSKITPQSSPSLLLSSPTGTGKSKKRKITNSEEGIRSTADCTSKAEEENQNVMAVATDNVDSNIRKNENLNRSKTTVLERDKSDSSIDFIESKAVASNATDGDADKDNFRDINNIKTSVQSQQQQQQQQEEEQQQKDHLHHHQQNGDFEETKICSSPSDTNQGDLISVMSSHQPLSQSIIESKSEIDKTSDVLTTVDDYKVVGDDDVDEDDVDENDNDEDAAAAVDFVTVEDNQILPSFNSLDKENRTGLRVDTITGKPQQFKEWHEVLQVRSYNDELLTILPYVVID